MREEARLPVQFDVACAGLARIERGGRLLDASQAAYGGGVTGLAKVGPPSAWPDLSKLVLIRVGDMAITDDSAAMPLRWEATGPGSGLYPALDADITMTRDGDHATLLVLTGVYRPPLGKLGTLLDHALLNRIASATIRDFVSRLTQAIERPSSPGDQSSMDGDGR